MTAVEGPAVAAGVAERLREALAAALASFGSLEPYPTERLILDPALLAADDATAYLLERLSRKVEVGRRLLAAYADELGKPVDDRPVRAEVSTHLACLFVFVGLVRGDWKFLNTAMKMQDGILIGMPITLPDAFADALRACLDEAA